MNTSAGALGEAAIRIDYVLTQNLKARRLPQAPYKATSEFRLKQNTPSISGPPRC